MRVMNAVQETAQRLLILPDEYQALLAEYDYFPAHDLLYVRWHGHLTAPSIIQGAQAGLDLFRGRPLPQRILTNHSRVSGEWNDAIPWLHYEWLPQAVERGVRLLSHVLATSAFSSGAIEGAPDGPEFLEALNHELLVRSFRCPLAAWHWATTR